MRQFHDIISKALIEKDDIWYNMTSIFIAPWDFIQTAAYVYSHDILPDNHKQMDNSIISYKNEFIRYCHEIDKINLPKTKQLLLSDKRFFNAYTEYPGWVQELLSVLEYEYAIVIHVISRFYKLKNEAFSNEEKELQILHDILHSYEYNKPKHMVSDLELELFLNVFLPSKME